MNFLAHLYLSGNHPKIMVGNFIGDFVKGRNLYDQFEHEIAVGIELHRALDEFTDHHPAVQQGKLRLRARYRHYAGVIIDIFYDHFLARNWNNHHETLLPDYAEQVYRLMEQHENILPDEVKYMLSFMTKGNWLVNYARLEGIDRALKGMARRTTHISNMEHAVEDLNIFYDRFLEEFNLFFPDAKKFAALWLEQKNSKT